MQSFKALDLNGDGMISLEEMAQGIQKYMKASRNEARIIASKIFDRVDLDRSGYISYS